MDKSLKYRPLTIYCVVLIAVCSVSMPWLTSRKRSANIEPSNVMAPWEIASTNPRPAFPAFDATSDKLCGCLISQRAAWESGLVSYLGLDTYNGTLDSTRHRLVWWQTRVRTEDNREVFVLLADHHRESDTEDCSACIVTDSSYDLVHWEKMSIDCGTTTSVRLDGEILPCKLSYHVVPRSGTNLDGVTWVVQLGLRAFGTPSPSATNSAQLPTHTESRIADYHCTTDEAPLADQSFIVRSH